MLHVNQNENQKQNDEIVLSVYFCGTGQSITMQTPDGNTIQAPVIAAQFAGHDEGQELNPDMQDFVTNEIDIEKNHQYKMSFDGCGVVHPFFGTIFAYGIEDQCEQVVKEVKNILEIISTSNSKNKIVINIYGFSRGATAALLTAIKLGNYPVDLVEVNLALHDPVPGNLIISSKLDIFNLTLANQVMNLKECHNLKRVLCLYTYIQEPDYYFHAPINPDYPAGTEVEEDIILGFHTQAEVTLEKCSVLVISRMKNFMKSCGTDFENNDWPKTDVELNPTVYNSFLNNRDYIPANNVTSTRACHASTSERSEIKYYGSPSYVNGDHRRLETGMEFKRIFTKSLPMPETEELFILLETLTNSVIQGLTDESKITKGKFLEGLKMKADKISENDVDENAIKNFATQYLRILVCIALQRDRNACSFFTTTTSGEKLVELLGEKKYAWFAQLVMGTAAPELPRYADLLSYAGGYDSEAFSADYRDMHYQQFASLLLEPQLNINVEEKENASFIINNTRI